MTLQRMDNVGIVVTDLIAMMRTPDGHGRLER
jgi:hypothetical protein